MSDARARRGRATGAAGPGIVVASRNPAKVAAVARAVAGLAAVGPLPHDISPEAGDEAEGEGSFAVIAGAKAVAGSRALAVGGGGGGAEALVVATDGGLLVPALGAAWDPTRTRRFARGPTASARDRADSLLALADHLEGDERRIGWREALAVARDGRIVAAWVAESPVGLLARDYDPARLEDGGFWVPALWCCPEFGGRRLVDLSPAEHAVRADHWTRLGEDLRRFLLEG